MSDIPRFGASDFFLVQTDAAQLREQLRDALAALLGRPVVDADPHMVLASAFLPYLVQGQASADACAKATLRAFAIGQNLDRIADSTCVVGYLDRMPARGAILPMLLTALVTRSDATVASNCRITWTAKRVVELDDGTTLTFSGSGETALDFSITAGLSKPIAVPMYLVCETAGTVGNGLFFDLLGFALDDEVSIEASAVETSGETEAYTIERLSGYRCGRTYGGAAEESDEAFAVRVGWQGKAVRVPGSLEYFRLALSELRYLASWYIAPSVDAQGRIVASWCDKVNWLASYMEISLTDRGAAYKEFLDALKGSMLVEQRAYAYPAIKNDAWLTATYYLPASTVSIDAARKAVEDAWEGYVDAHAWHCGAVLRVSDVCEVLTSAGASYVVTRARTPSLTLPADNFVTTTAFALIYGGLSSDEAAPSGSDGEEVVP